MGNNQASKATTAASVAAIAPPRNQTASLAALHASHLSPSARVTDTVVESVPRVA